MKSVLTTRTEIYERFVALLSDYKGSFDKIEGLAEEIQNHISSVELEVSQGEEFDDQEVKLLLGNLNMHQTYLVNTLRSMNELHAKMGYLVN